jgi:osmotically-inducible protein OsmY
MMIRANLAVVLGAVLGLGAGSLGVQAQNAPSASDKQSAQNQDSDTVSRVKSALHSDPALNDKHIDVSMEKGKVVMRGFVNTQGDLQKAIKAANNAAGGLKVVNELTIQRHEDSESETR